MKRILRSKAEPCFFPVPRTLSTFPGVQCVAGMDRDNSRRTENSLRTNACLKRLYLWHTTIKGRGANGFPNTQVQKRNHVFHTAEQTAIHGKSDAYRVARREDARFLSTSDVTLGHTIASHVGNPVSLRKWHRVFSSLIPACDEPADGLLKR